MNTKIVVSNPFQNMNVSLYLYLWYVKMAAVWRADPPSKNPANYL
jgi:hypothetical protein